MPKNPSLVVAATQYANARLKTLESEDLEAPLTENERRLLRLLLMNAYIAGAEARSR